MKSLGSRERFSFYRTRVPALVIGVVRDGKTTVLGFGETSEGSGKPPDGQTMLRVGSLTKAFTGQVLASLAADGTVKFTDRLQDRIGWDVTVPTRDGHEITLDRPRDPFVGAATGARACSRAPPTTRSRH